MMQIVKKSKVKKKSQKYISDPFGFLTNITVKSDGHTGYPNLEAVGYHILNMVCCGDQVGYLLLLYRSSRSIT